MNPNFLVSPKFWEEGKGTSPVRPVRCLSLVPETVCDTS